MTRRGQKPAPGLRMPCGSRACLDPPGEGHDVGAELRLERAEALSRPTPCSPVIVPPSSMAVAMISSKASRARRSASASPGGVDDRRVGVAVAGVGHDRDLDVVPLGDGLDGGEQGGQLRDRHADVLGQHGAAGLDGGEVQAPGLHEHLALLGVVGAEDLLGAGHLAGRGRPRPPRRRGRPPGASLWMRRSAPASRSRPIGRKSSTALIEAWSISSTSEARTVRPSSMTAAAAAATVGKVATTVDVGACAGTSRRIGPGDDAEGALRADEELEQRQAGDVLDPLAAEGDQGAVGEHDVEAEHVVGGDAVLHAAQAAGVGGDVAADRADLERAGVRRVPEAVLGRGAA